MSHIQPEDGQILLYSVTDWRAHNRPAVQIENDGKVEPTL